MDKESQEVAEELRENLDAAKSECERLSRLNATLNSLLAEHVRLLNAAYKRLRTEGK